MDKQLNILKDINNIPFKYSFNEIIKDNNDYKSYELIFENGIYNVFIWLIFLNDYPFKAPIIIFQNLHAAAKHELLDEFKKVNMCDYCPAIDIRQLIINCYCIFNEILEREENEDLVELQEIAIKI